MENFECSITFEYKGFVERKISPICHMIGNLLIHKIVLVFPFELKAHSHSLTSFQVPLVSAMYDG